MLDGITAVRHFAGYLLHLLHSMRHPQITLVA